MAKKATIKEAGFSAALLRAGNSMSAILQNNTAIEKALYENYFYRNIFSHTGDKKTYESLIIKFDEISNEMNVLGMNIGNRNNETYNSFLSYLAEESSISELATDVEFLKNELHNYFIDFAKIKKLGAWTGLIAFVFGIVLNVIFFKYIFSPSINYIDTLHFNFDLFSWLDKFTKDPGTIAFLFKGVSIVWLLILIFISFAFLSILVVVCMIPPFYLENKYIKNKEKFYLDKITTILEQQKV